MILGNLLMIWGKRTNPRFSYGVFERLKMERVLKRLSQSNARSLVKVTRKQMWFDLIAAKTTPEQID